MHDSFRIKWDILIMILAAWNCFTIPYQASFSIQNNIQLLIFDAIIDFLFFVDIVLNFRTTVVHPKTGQEIVDPKEIRNYYITSGKFFIDFVAVAPIDIILDMIF